MKVDLPDHHRRSVRLKGYDYSQAGAYFITIVTWQRLMLFGKIENGGMQINRYGEIVQKWWDKIPEHFPNAETGAFIIMPNHVHGIIIITDGRGTVSVPHIVAKTQMDGIEHQGGGTPPLRKPRLGQIVAYFKYQSTREINIMDGGRIAKLWQRNYYEHILRDEHEMENTWNYIRSNPGMWALDEENPLK